MPATTRYVHTGDCDRNRDTHLNSKASMFEPDFKYTFFGNHYDKLKAIKNVYDSVGLFVVIQKEGVGSDDWDMIVATKDSLPFQGSLKPSHLYAL